jgi:hypothetical protein
MSGRKFTTRYWWFVSGHGFSRAGMVFTKHGL